MTQCRRWLGARGGQRAYCIKEKGHDERGEGPCLFEMGDGMHRKAVAPELNRCHAQRRKFLGKRKLIWRCVSERKHDGEHTYSVAPDKEEWLGRD